MINPFGFVSSVQFAYCNKLSLSLILLFLSFHLSAQEEKEEISLPDSITTAALVIDSINPDLTHKDSIEIAQAALMAQKDSIRAEKRKSFTYVDTTPFRDSLSIYYWKISENLGEFRPADPDTMVTGFPNRHYVDGMGVSMAYLGNLGTPAVSRIFSEREPLSNFMFADAYNVYNRTPGNFNFINTRVPYSNLGYETEGDGSTQNERLTGGISVNLNKKLNIGFDLDYIYTHGRYNSQSASLVDLVVYSSYFSDRYRYHFFFNNRDDVNYENGGITDDRYITSPEAIDQTQNMRSQDIPTQISNTWNRIRGSRFFYTHRYNLGFERETGEVDKEGEDITQFIAVGSIIHTADMNIQKHKFISNDSNLDNLYPNRYLDMATCDTTRAWNFKNTLGISLREGFSQWAKFDLTAYASFDYRQYLLMEKFDPAWVQTQTSTFVGGELAKTTGKYFRYNAQTEFGVLGENLGDVTASGTIETRIPVLKDTASLKAKAYIKNLTPSFYEKHYHSKYFWWDHDDFNQTQRVYIGGELDIPHTRTRFSAGAENVSNYVYFDLNALPQQYTESVQLISARLDQNFQFKALHWDNQLVYQKSANESIIPVPDLTLYTNLYLNFTLFKVLRMQLGADAHYFTTYYSPTYEPATQQFHIQKDVEIGNYPFINAYINCKLYQTRFFINFYNIGSSFIDGGAYFSLPHYPVNPMVMKLGLSIDFNN